MRILFLHPDDSPESGPWFNEPWDRVVDLGMAGPDTYHRWSQIFSTGVESVGFQAIPPEPVREALAQGLRVVRDDYGIDWWEVLSVGFIQQLYRVCGLQQIASGIRAGDQVVCSRAGFDSRALEILMGRKIECAPARRRRFDAARGALKKVRRLSHKQILQIIADKCDAEHLIRARFAPRRAGRKDSVVLLPTAYVNVSRTALAYARSLPEMKFLLVAARRSGWCSQLPENVQQADLASYVSRETRTDGQAFRASLDTLRPMLARNSLLRVLTELHAFDFLEQQVDRWISVRNAWAEVFNAEPVTSVLCCDDSNPYTLIPLLIAKKRGLATIAAHHGALDGQRLLKPCHADVVLVKGTMEADYVLRRCRVEENRVLVGAPRVDRRNSLPNQRTKILFFSEDYEVSGGRVAEFYHSVLPALAELARERKQDLIVKLHPAENLRERRRIIDRLLSSEERTCVQILDGPLDENLLNDAWFALTGASTTAVECAERGIPVFLCAWLDTWPYGYLQQFIKFGVGKGLDRPELIRRIPSMLKEFEAFRPETVCQPAALEQLRAAFSGQRSATNTTCGFVWPHAMRNNTIEGMTVET